MPPVGDVSFELERFEWTADDRLEVVGRWNGVRGRRMARPALTVEAGGRRQRVSGQRGAPTTPTPWRASFDWDGARGDIAGAELELGRSLVVELPPPRRRRRRRGAAAEVDLRAQVDELRATVAELRAERDAAPPTDELAARSARRARCAASERAREPAERRPRELERARRSGGADGGARRAPSGSPPSSRRCAPRARRREPTRCAREADASRGRDRRARRACGSPTAACGPRTSSSRTSSRRCARVRDERDELAGQLEQLRAQRGRRGARAGRSSAR